MYIYYLLINSPAREKDTQMNSSISTPFNRQSTINKRIERWYGRTWDGSGKFKVVCTCTSLGKCPIRFYFCFPITLGVNIYPKISQNILLQILLFYLSLNHRSTVPFSGVVSLVCFCMNMAALDPLLCKPRGCLNISHFTQRWGKRCATDALLDEKAWILADTHNNRTVTTCKIIWHIGESHLKNQRCLHRCPTSLFISNTSLAHHLRIGRPLSEVRCV